MDSLNLTISFTHFYEKLRILSNTDTFLKFLDLQYSEFLILGFLKVP